MTNNFYWSVYKSLEKELVELSNSIHVDDKQLGVYSIKIVELLIRTSIEIESISKTLYFINGGTKPDDKELYFDTDCINLLESKWKLSKKKVWVNFPNFYFTNIENKILTPLYKANNRGSSSSDWQKAYQAIKHNRVKSLSKGNLKYLIRSMAALYLLNIYLSENKFSLGIDSSGINFDCNLGSSIFAIKLHKHDQINLNGEFNKNIDFDECVYLFKPTNESITEVINSRNQFNKNVAERLNKNLPDKISRMLQENPNSINEDDNIKFDYEQIKLAAIVQETHDNGNVLKKSLKGLEYEVVLNKDQF